MLKLNSSEEYDFCAFSIQQKYTNMDKATYKTI